MDMRQVLTGFPNEEAPEQTQLKLDTWRPNMKLKIQDANNKQHQVGADHRLLARDRRAVPHLCFKCL